ncbi:hypothetical protein SFC08_14750 [Lysinibacillus halotolerans]
MDYDKVLTYLISISTVIHLLTSSAKNIKDIRQSKKKEKRRPPAKKKRRK